jgi:hypothetical protein
MVVECWVVGSYHCISALPLGLFAVLDLCQFIPFGTLLVLTACRGVAIGRGWDELTGLADQYVATSCF